MPRARKPCRWCEKEVVWNVKGYWQDNDAPFSIQRTCDLNPHPRKNGHEPRTTYQTRVQPKIRGVKK